jgi:hypothetical protein
MKIPAFLHLMWLLILIASCSQDEPHTANFTTHIVRGRNHQPVYRIKVPSHWIFKEPANDESLIDTTKSIGELLTDDIRITIHNFSSNSIEERIPFRQQILRWKNQFDELQQESIAISPQSFNGFSGAMLEASGTIAGKSKSVIAWSMQIAPEHYRKLECAERKSCYTIKAVGPAREMEEKKAEITKCARSFEMIDEVCSK